MNNKLIRFLTLSVSIFCGAVLAKDSVVEKFEREQTEWNVRVVLLKVERNVVFTDQGLSNTKDTNIYAIPGLNVIYMVEALGTEPIKTWLEKSDGSPALVDGKKIEPEANEKIAGGGVSSRHEFTHYDWGFMKQPEVKNPKRAQIVSAWFRGLKIPNDKFDLQLTVGFNEEKHSFLFKDIPAN